MAGFLRLPTIKPVLTDPRDVRGRVPALRAPPDTCSIKSVTRHATCKVHKEGRVTITAKPGPGEEEKPAAEEEWSLSLLGRALPVRVVACYWAGDWLYWCQQYTTKPGVWSVGRARVLDGSERSEYFLPHNEEVHMLIWHDNVVVWECSYKPLAGRQTEDCPRLSIYSTAHAWKTGVCIRDSSSSHNPRVDRKQNVSLLAHALSQLPASTRMITAVRHCSRSNAIHAIVARIWCASESKHGSVGSLSGYTAIWSTAALLAGTAPQIVPDPSPLRRLAARLLDTHGLPYDKLYSTGYHTVLARSTLQHTVSIHPVVTAESSRENYGRRRFLESVVVRIWGTRHSKSSALPQWILRRMDGCECPQVLFASLCLLSNRLRVLWTHPETGRLTKTFFDLWPEVVSTEGDSARLLLIDTHVARPVLDVSAWVLRFAGTEFTCARGQLSTPTSVWVWPGETEFARPSGRSLAWLRSLDDRV